jgi:hypothetical protein
VTYDRLREDSKRILTTGFTLAVVFKSPTGTEYTANAFFSDIGMGFDANGMPMVDRRIALSVSCLSADGTVIFTEANYPSTSMWRATFTYNGTTFYGEVQKPMLDRTMACIDMTLGKVKVLGS